MNAPQATAKLVEIRTTWRNNGSSIEFSKAEGEVFQEFRKTNSDWLASWPEVQLAAHEQVK